MPKQDQLLLTDRLDAEPSIFRGCSLRELTVMAGVAGLVWLPICLVGAALVGSVTMGFGVSGVFVVVTVVAGASIFQRLKANRPNGYYQQICHLWLARRKVLKSPYIVRSGRWDLGRS